MCARPTLMLVCVLHLHPELLEVCHKLLHPAPVGLGPVRCIWNGFRPRQQHTGTTAAAGRLGLRCRLNTHDLSKHRRCAKEAHTQSQ
jgi:hypothetical protein